MAVNFEKMRIKWKIFPILWKVYIFILRLFRAKKRPCLLVTLAVLLALTSAFWFLFRPEPYKYPDVQSMNVLVIARLHQLVLSDKGTGCVMPHLDPFTEEALMFSRDVQPLVCAEADWVECYHSQCKPTHKIQAQMKDLVCIYRDIIFVTDEETRFSDPVKLYGGHSYTLSDSDYVKVSCTGTDVSGLGLISSRWFGYKLGFRPVQRPAPTASALNIMIIIFDSASRNGFIRRMPNSYKYLVEELNAVVMKRFNIVGDGTPGALFPMLTGYTELELPDSRRFKDNDRYVDDTRFIFHHLKKKGYRTLYFEDMPWIGTFQYRFNGFRDQPADHYARPFFMEESRHCLMWWCRERYCVGGQPIHTILLDAITQLYELSGNKFSVTHISSVTHDDFNMISVADTEMVTFLHRYRKYMEDTVLVVMGDHGPRWSAIRNTYQGKVEEKLPFVSIVLPQKLVTSRPNALINLASNSEVLTTHHDIHTTLLDILELKEKRNKFVVPGADMERGLSLLEPIPQSRSCSEAGIMPHWCACATWVNVTSTEVMYGRAALALAEYINGLAAEKLSKCATRTLSSIVWVVRQSPNDGMLGFRGRKEVDRYIGRYEKSNHVKARNEYYQAKIIMNPGQSIYEGSMQYKVIEDIFDVTESEISRINGYDEESQCVKTYAQLRKYCYCRDKLGSKHI